MTDLPDLVLAYFLARDVVTSVTLAAATDPRDDRDAEWSRRLRAAVSDELDAEEALRRAVGVDRDGPVLRVLLVAHAARVAARGLR